MPTTMLVTFENGEVWGVPCAIIAESRAEYYAKKDAECEGKDYDTAYKEEYDYALGDKSELADWAFNNMNWSDVAEHATKVQSATSKDYEEEWSNVDHSFIS